MLRGIRRNFFRLSPCCGQVPYVLLTRAPVAGRSIAAPPLPLDLHVLSLSLAFILSQDQTLRCFLLSYFSSFQSKSSNRNDLLFVAFAERRTSHCTHPEDGACRPADMSALNAGLFRFFLYGMEIDRRIISPPLGSDRLLYYFYRCNSFQCSRA